MVPTHCSKIVGRGNFKVTYDKNNSCITVSFITREWPDLRALYFRSFHTRARVGIFTSIFPLLVRDEIVNNTGNLLFSILVQPLCHAVIVHTAMLVAKGSIWGWTKKAIKNLSSFIIWSAGFGQMRLSFCVLSCYNSSVAKTKWSAVHCAGGALIRKS